MTQPSRNPAIQVLPQSVINKIAAGEVIERPASVVKELVENSLDAQASRVEVTLEEGGVRLIRVADDGVGMIEEDVSRAFLPHATSKLSGPDDLFNIKTMGFRGEALASIASISQVRLASRARGELAGAEITADGGVLSPPRAAGLPEGTVVEVRNLFHNTPVRRKFLKTPATEARHAAEAVTRLALPRPDVTFHLTHDGRPVLRLAAAPDPRARVLDLFGPDTAEALLDLHQETPALSVTGFAGPPTLAQRSPQMQYAFLNGRFIRDRVIQRAMAEAYRGRMVTRTFPVVILFLWMDPQRVDVNVHPTKIEVRFRDPGAVYTLVLAALERALAGAATAPSGAPPPAQPLPPATPQAETPRRVEQAMRDFFTSRPEPAAFPPFRPSPSPTQAARPGSLDETHTLRRPEPEPLPPPPAGRNVLQVLSSYIVEETGGGFRLIDQHALHERLLYDDLSARAREATVSRQRLLVPEVVELKPADAMMVMEMKDALARMGLEVEDFGGGSVAVQTVPHMLRHANPANLLKELVEDLRATAEDSSAIPREERLLRSLACRGAVKAGKPLRPGDIDALLDQRDRLCPAPTCPHGRPHTLVFSAPDLERQFRRRL